VKRLLAIIAAIMFISAAGSAQADPASPTCGSNNHYFVVNANGATYDGNQQWTAYWVEYCGSGATVTVEFQQSTDCADGQNCHWYDMGGMTDSVFTQQSGGNAENRTHVYQNTSQYCIVNGHQYRMKVWADPQAGVGAFSPYDTSPVAC
jgi:hypothetical protein